MEYKIRLYDFYADWCQPCKQVSTLLDQVLPDYPNIELVKVNVEGDIDFTDEKGIRGVPTLIFEKEGVEYKRFTGSISKDKLISFIEEGK